MNLVMITQQFPYGKGETYLETEIGFAADIFDKVYVISISQDTMQTRALPDNVHPVKLSRKYKTSQCVRYALRMLFSAETFAELRNLKKLTHCPSFAVALKEWLKARLLLRRIELGMRELEIPWDTVGYSYWLNIGAYCIAKNRDKFVYTVSRAHGFELRDSEVYIPFRLSIESGLDEIAFISENAKKCYAEIMEPLRGDTCPAVMSLKRLGVSPKQNNEIADKIFRIVSCSGVYRLKRLDLIVDALSMLDTEYLVEWIHFGWGIDGDSIVSRCHDKLDGKNIRWEIKGWVDNNKVMEYYKSTNVSLFINMSDMEGIPVSMMEAESFGIPCIARSVGGNPEIVVDGISGYLLHNEVTPSVIAGRLCEIINGFASGANKVSRNMVLNFYNNLYNAEMNYKKFYEQLTFDARKGGKNRIYWQ